MLSQNGIKPFPLLLGLNVDCSGEDGGELRSSIAVGLQHLVYVHDTRRLLSNELGEAPGGGNPETKIVPSMRERAERRVATKSVLGLAMSVHEEQRLASRQAVQERALRCLHPGRSGTIRRKPPAAACLDGTFRIRLQMTSSRSHCAG